MVIGTKRLAEVFKDWGCLLSLDGTENPFRVQAYTKAADSLLRICRPYVLVWELGILEGFGPSMVQKASEFASNGGIIVEFESLKERKKKFLPVLDLVKVRGIGPKKAKKLVMDGVTSIEDLKKKAKKEGNVELVRACKSALANKEYHTLAGARHYVSYFSSLIKVPFSVAGSYRRHCPAVRDLDILVKAKNWSNFIKALKKANFTFTESGPEKLHCEEGTLPFDVRRVPKGCMGTFLQYFTGSAAHNIALRKKYKGLSEFDWKGKKYNKEDDLYEAMIGYWIPPALREGSDLPSEKIVSGLIKNEMDMGDDYHVHVFSTDSNLKLAEHSGSYIMEHAHHLKERPVCEKKVFLEVDIPKDGTIKLPDWADGYGLAVHKHFSGDQTNRLVKAMGKARETKKPTILVHPLASKFPARMGIAADWEFVFGEAAKLGVRVEINGQPDRLDYGLLKIAKSAGCKFTWGSDAHSKTDLGYDRYALYMAQKAGLTPDDFKAPRFSVGASAMTKAQKDS